MMRSKPQMKKVREEVAKALIVDVLKEFTLKKEERYGTVSSRDGWIK